MLIAIALAVVVAAGGAVTLVLTTGGNGFGLIAAPGSSSAQAPTAGSGAPDSNGSPPSSTRPLPPPTPTGRLYENDDPQVGQCVDVSRNPTRAVSIYEADCSDPAATLILESVLPENQKCPGKGYFGLKSLSKQRMCFTYNFQTGDCVDMQIPRRAACADATAPGDGKPLVTVAEIRLGQRDGAGCPNPELFLQTGKDNERGVACLIPGSNKNTPSPQPSR